MKAPRLPLAAAGLSICLASPVLADSEARSEERPAGVSGFENGVRIGLGLPFGSAGSGRALAEDVAVRVPLTVDLGYRLSHAFHLGLAAQIGVGFPGEGCLELVAGDGAVRDPTCAYEDVRVSLQGMWHVLPPAPDALDLWVGAAIGWERSATVTRFAYSVTGTQITSGQAHDVSLGVIGELQAGLDFKVLGPLRIGPYVSYAAGRYMGRRIVCSPPLQCEPADGITGSGVHHWVTAGIRTAFGP